MEKKCQFCGCTELRPYECLDGTLGESVEAFVCPECLNVTFYAKPGNAAYKKAIEEPEQKKKKMEQINKKIQSNNQDIFSLKIKEKRASTEPNELKKVKAELEKLEDENKALKKELKDLKK